MMDTGKKVPVARGPSIDYRVPLGGTDILLSVRINPPGGTPQAGNGEADSSIVDVRITDEADGTVLFCETDVLTRGEADKLEQAMSGEVSRFDPHEDGCDCERCFPDG